MHGGEERKARRGVVGEEKRDGKGQVRPLAMEFHARPRSQQPAPIASQRAKRASERGERTSTRFMFGTTALTSRMTLALDAGSNFSSLTAKMVFSFGAD